MSRDDCGAGHGFGLANTKFSGEASSRLRLVRCNLLFASLLMALATLPPPVCVQMDPTDVLLTSQPESRIRAFRRQILAHVLAIDPAPQRERSRRQDEGGHKGDSRA